MESGGEGVGEEGGQGKGKVRRDRRFREGKEDTVGETASLSL